MGFVVVIGGIVQLPPPKKRANTNKGQFRKADSWIRKVVTDFLFSRLMRTSKIASWYEDWEGN